MCGPALMGVLNVTPDSFSDTGLFSVTAAAIEHGQRLFEEGADIVDVGGEASGVGSVPCSEEEELRRVIPVVEALSVSGKISVDTTKSRVASRALERGACIINDISGLRHDPQMVHVLQGTDASVVIMFSKESGSSPLVSEHEILYTDVVGHIGDFLSRQIDFALAQGMRTDQIIVDPGMGRFVSSNPALSWEIIGRLSELCRMFSDFRVLVGVSRKGFLGGAVSDRDPISQLIGVYALEQGVSILRTHNVRMAKAFNQLMLIAERPFKVLG